MLESTQNWRLNFAAFALSLLAGWMALAGEPFLLVWMFASAVGAALFHPSPQLKVAARFALLGFGVGIVVVFIVLINSDMD